MKKNLVYTILSGLFLLVVLLSSLYIFSFRLNGSKNIKILYGSEFKDLGYHINIFSFTLDKYVKTENSVNTNKLGHYKVIYKLPFKKLVRNVDVVDNIAPVITLEGDTNIELTVHDEYQEKGFKAFDNYDGDLTEKVIISNSLNINKIGTYKLNYQVLDSSKNKSLSTRTIKVIDNISPVIKLKGLDKIVVVVGNTYEDELYEAFDNYDGDITKNVKVENNINYQKTGTYYIKYSVSDSSLNYSEVFRNVEVIDKIDMTYIKGILLVNKKYHLPANYNPKVNIEAYSYLEKMQEDALNQGFSLPLLSGFRSYETQKYLFNDYKNRYGYEKANTFSALPGQSEHQTGLAFDVGEINDNFGNTRTGIWLKENAYKYGFIIRYLKGKEDITGYKYEPWHIRYVGIYHATNIYNQGITLEEYLGVN